MPLPILPILILTLVECPPIVAAHPTDDVYGDVAAASLTGDATAGTLAFSVTGDAEGELGISLYGRSCSNALPKPCDENGLANPDDTDLLRVDAHPTVLRLDGCDPHATVFVNAAGTGATCGDGCARRVALVALAVLDSASACEGEACDRNVVALNLAVGGDSELCTDAGAAALAEGPSGAPTAALTRQPIGIGGRGTVATDLPATSMVSASLPSAPGRWW